MKNFIVTIAVIIGFAGGFLFESVRTDARIKDMKAQVVAAAQQSSLSTCERRDTSVLRLKTQLLQDYVNFVFQPSWTMNKQEKTDAVRNMSDTVAKIGESELSEKYVATGDASGKDESILAFFNLILDDLKKGLE